MGVWKNDVNLNLILILILIVFSKQIKIKLTIMITVKTHCFFKSNFSVVRERVWTLRMSMLPTCHWPFIFLKSLG